jgi:hypothetical protein
MKKVIFLIIASHDNPIYEFMRNVSNIYFNRMEMIYNLKHFYVEFKKMEVPINLVDDTIYVNGEEMLSRAIIKTHKALQYINANFDYDILIRTNLSSFWNIPYLYKYINHLENNNIVTGIFLNTWFNNTIFNYITGTGVIITKDISIKLCTFDLQGEPEDIWLSYYLKQITNIQEIPNHKWVLLMNGSNNLIPNDISEILYFRVRTDIDNRIYDRYAFITLLKKIYDISLD